MKLRNKKTGDIVNAMFYAPMANYDLILWKDKLDPSCHEIRLGNYKALAELNEEWEDYNPAEPLIKDEKIRKAVREWAEANNLSGASTYKTWSDAHYWYIRAFDDSEKAIDLDIWGELPRELVDCKYYTIAELCGEEKE